VDEPQRRFGIPVARCAVGRIEALGRQALVQVLDVALRDLACGLEGAQVAVLGELDLAKMSGKVEARAGVLVAALKAL